MNDPKSFERKAFLSPQAFVNVLFAIRGGQFLDDPNFDLESLLGDIDFPVGEEGKLAKKKSAEEGNVLVSKSIITTTGSTKGDIRVLLVHREESHLITQGASILTSGDPRLSPNEVLANKVTIQPASVDFRRLGLALSSPAKTGGVNYLFQVLQATIPDDAVVTTLKDHGTLLSLDEIRAAIADKPVELAILNNLRTNAA